MIIRFKYISLIVFQLILLSGCRVKYSFSGGDVPADAKTVSVTLFQNNAPLAGPNTHLFFTESLRDLLLSQTRLTLVQEEGDIRYEGSVTGFSIQPVAIQNNETAALNRLTLTVSVKYTNTLEEEKNFEQSFSRFTDYPSDQDFNSNEEQLLAEVNRQLVQDIFDRSLGNW